MPFIAGCDFSSSPSRRKPIVFALGSLSGARVQLSSLEYVETLEDYARWLAEERSWVCGFDMPFGLPRELVSTLGWPEQWLACMEHYGALSRAQIRTAFSAFCNARPVGGKFAHRATDLPAGSSSSMKWVNPPVAYMLHAGVPALIACGAHLPGLHEGNALQDGMPRRVALEAYPGLLARELLQPVGSTPAKRRSYKNDAKALQTPDRLIARKDIITALESGRTRLGLRLKLTHAQRDRLADDATGDSLDAVLCLMQAAWAVRQHEAGHARYGLPEVVDPLEGWIVSA
ncbi:MAG: DUF429 domain-containing protein [Pseudomonadota bacterium]